VGRRRTELNRTTATIAEVQQSMLCSPTQEGFYRLQAITFLYKGYSKEEVARLCDVTLRAVQQWVKTFNDSGIDGVLGSARTGRKRKISQEVFATKYKEKFLSSTKTALCFHGELVNQYREKLCYQTLLNYFKEQGLSRVAGRPECIQRDEEKRASFLKNFKCAIRNNEEVWFCDEVGFDGDPKPRRRWVMKGEKPKNPFYKLHLRSSAIGAVNPVTGEFFSHVVPHVDKQVFQIYLDAVNEHLNRKITLVLDNASWHTKDLNWGNINPLFLAPYSPDLNPIEQLWKLIKDKFFNGWYAKTIDELDQRVCMAMQYLINQPEQVTKTASMAYMINK
jgi:transposase